MLGRSAWSIIGYPSLPERLVNLGTVGLQSTAPPGAGEGGGVRGCLPHHRMPTPQRNSVGATSRELLAKAEPCSEQGGRATECKQMQLRLLHSHMNPSAQHTPTVIHTAPLPRPSRQESVAHPVGAVTHAILRSVSCRTVDMLLRLLLLCRLLRLVSSATPVRARQ